MMERITTLETEYELLSGRDGYFRIKSENHGYYHTQSPYGVGVMRYDGHVMVSPVWDDVLLTPKDGPTEMFILRDYNAGWGTPQYVFHLETLQGKRLHQDCYGTCIGVREGVAVFKDGTGGIYCLSGSRHFPKKFYKDGPMGTDCYDYQALFHDGRLRVLDRKGRGYFVDQSGDEISKHFPEARDFHNGVAVVGIGRLWPPLLYGTIGTNGKYIMWPSYEEIRDYKNNYARVRKNGKYGYIDRNGNERVPPMWDVAEDFDADGLAFVRSLNPVAAAMIDRSGQQVVQLPLNCTLARSYSEDLLAVRAEKLGWGFVDREGHWVIAPQYFDVGDFCNGVAPVRKALDAWVFIDCDGKEVLSVEGRLTITEKGLACSDHTIYNYGYTRK